MQRMIFYLAFVILLIYLMKAGLLLALIFILTSCDQLVPIQKNGYGFSIGDAYGKLQIQAFLDFQCPDSKNSYAILKEVMRTIDFSQKGIKFTFQMMPLQFHYYAFKIHQCFAYVQNNASPAVTQQLITYLFDHQNQFTEQVLMNYTLDNFLDQLATLVAAQTKVNQQALRAELNTQSQTDYLTRYHWKYSVGTHGISGAPIFNANGVRIDGAENWGFSEWIEFFKKYAG